MTITTDHPASSYGIPVILDDSGNPMNYAAGIKAVRKRLKLSRAQLAALVNSSPRTVERWEQGLNPAPTNALNVLADLLARRTE